MPPISNGRMNPDTDLDALDRALSRTAARHVPPPLDPQHLRRRRARLEVGPYGWLFFVVALVTAVANDHRWALAGGLALLLPAAIANLVHRHREIASMGSVEDLAAFERSYFGAQAKHQRSALLIEVVLTVVFAAVAWSTGTAWRWIVPAVFGAMALARAVLVLPYVERVNRDVGGERPHGWIVLSIVFGIFLLYPFLLVANVARSAWRRVAGRREDPR